MELSSAHFFCEKQLTNSQNGTMINSLFKEQILFQRENPPNYPKRRKVYTERRQYRGFFSIFTVRREKNEKIWTAIGVSFL